VARPKLRGQRNDLVDLGGSEVGLCLATATPVPPMSLESQLREKLRKIEALFAGAGTAGERLAAERPDLQPISRGYWSFDRRPGHLEALKRTMPAK
jgi:hypothetical protein